MTNRLARLLLVREHRFSRAERRLKLALADELRYRQAHRQAEELCDDLQGDIDATEAGGLEARQIDIGEFQALHAYLQAQRRRLDDARAVARSRHEDRVAAEARRRTAAVALNQARLKREHAREQRAALERHLGIVRENLREEQALESWNVARSRVTG